MKYKAFIFDLDGTLLDTLDDITNSLNFALQKHSCPPRTKEEAKSFVGHGAGELVELALGKKGHPLHAQVLADFRAHYKNHAADKTQPYAKIIDTLKKLRESGAKIAVVSNKPDGAVKELCKHYFAGLTDYALGETPEILRKPAPDMLLHAVKQFGLNKQDVVFIGDSDVDAQTAQNAAVDFIGVTWGFRTPADMRPFGAKLFIDKPLSLLNML